MLDKINETIEEYENKLDDLNDGEKLLENVSTDIKNLVVTSINLANETDSFDKRLQSVLAGLQDIIAYLNKTQEAFLKDKRELEIKLETLEKIIEIDIPIEESPTSEQKDNKE